MDIMETIGGSAQASYGIGSTITQGGISHTPMNVVIDNVTRPMGGESHAAVLQTDYVRVWKKQ